MGDDLRIRFRGENMPLAFQDFFEGKIVFNDAIVDHSDSACLMGMSILIRWPSMGRPSSMTNPYPPIKGLSSDQLFQLC